ncbi:cytochrome c [Ottowia sp.]|uniref:c-type cytochrome n=1 Tax=Ottowia sp. TaxID=1898956 RepID=UPI002BD75AD8|nr:cytochrome c [Ottowia sp.]HOB65982.1 cytochrome c [Ottowia sp.]HPZ58158.1 cytochrome c [Ottowia sp.]HQD46769.1 cytochrome c [Ottowia sp.]
MTVLRRALLALAVLTLVGAAALWHLNFNDGVDVSASAPPGTDAATVQRGAYLARVGNCLACHTARGGVAAAGGRAIATPFGTVYTSNLTPDADTGIGHWSAAAFWRALHHGRSADGRLLNPVFPYTHTTLLTRADSDALFAYFSSLPPQRQHVAAHELRWPYGTQAALAVWRALYFRPGGLAADAAASDSVKRGAYLVQGVAHCSACHARRDALGGADWRDLSGGPIPGLGWYAPSLVAPHEAGVGDWPDAEIARLLQSGASRLGVASGPMAEVVFQGTQYLTAADLADVAAYLKALPPHDAPRTALPAPPARTRLATAGEKLYGQKCAACHGEQGEGVPGAYPPLAGNRAVTLSHTQNLLQVMLHGGFGPATATRPRPFGMPPFILELNDAEIASVLSHIRTAWGNRAPEVSPLDVLQMRQASSTGLR